MVPPTIRSRTTFVRSSPTCLLLGHAPDRVIQCDCFCDAWWLRVHSLQFTGSIVRSIREEFSERTMRARRYTIVIADRSSGVVRRMTISLRPALTLVLSLLLMPVLVGIG